MGLQSYSSLTRTDRYRPLVSLLSVLRILFQGDSITDWSRSRERDDILGSGYATMTAGELGFKYPGEYEFLNRGVSGNRSVDILARMQRDIIAVKPDIMSLLIGVNDIWHGIDSVDGITLEKYEIYCGLLLLEVKEALPEIKLMILEPFVLRGTVTNANWDKYKSGVSQMAEKARFLSEKHGAVFVPLQEKFDKALELAPAEYWSIDGVHPKAAGHCIIKNAWIESFEKHIR